MSADVVKLEATRMDLAREADYPDTEIEFYSMEKDELWVSITRGKIHMEFSVFGDEQIGKLAALLPGKEPEEGSGPGEWGFFIPPGYLGNQSYIVSQIMLAVPPSCGRRSAGSC